MIASIASPILLGALLACALHLPRGFAAAARVLGHRASAPVVLLAVVALLVVDGAPLLALQRRAGAPGGRVLRAGRIMASARSPTRRRCAGWAR